MTWAQYERAIQDFDETRGLDPNDGIDVESIQSFGWDIATEREGSEVTIDMNGTFEGENTIKFLQMEPNDDHILAGHFKITHQDDGKYTTYRISLDMEEALDASESGDTE